MLPSFAASMSAVVPLSETASIFAPLAMSTRVISACPFTAANMSYRLVDEGKRFEYRMYVRSPSARDTESLSTALLSRPEVIEFRLSPTGD